MTISGTPSRAISTACAWRSWCGANRRRTPAGFEKSRGWSARSERPRRQSHVTAAEHGRRSRRHDCCFLRMQERGGSRSRAGGRLVVVPSRRLGHASGDARSSCATQQPDHALVGGTGRRLTRKRGLRGAVSPRRTTPARWRRRSRIRTERSRPCGRRRPPCRSREGRHGSQSSACARCHHRRRQPAGHMLAAGLGRHTHAVERGNSGWARERQVGLVGSRRRLCAKPEAIRAARAVIRGHRRRDRRDEVSRLVGRRLVWDRPGARVTRRARWRATRVMERNGVGGRGNRRHGQMADFGLFSRCRLCEGLRAFAAGRFSEPSTESGKQLADARVHHAEYAAEDHARLASTASAARMGGGAITVPWRRPFASTRAANRIRPWRSGRS
jgi:hypothetical protein